MKEELLETNKRRGAVGKKDLKRMWEEVQKGRTDQKIIKREVGKKICDTEKRRRTKRNSCPWREERIGEKIEGREASIGRAGMQTNETKRGEDKDWPEEEVYKATLI